MGAAVGRIRPSSVPAIVDGVRARTEVSLDAHGRNLASEAMSEQ
ncbi:hypothetical protein [Halosimplex rubrum]|nr:hypothetical protein [Halosimplex rubrum]